MGTPEYIADVCGGWKPDTLRRHLTGDGLLTQWARLVRCDRDDDDWDAWTAASDGSGDTNNGIADGSRRWIIHVEPVGDHFAKIPAWWLWEPYTETLSNGQVVDRRRRRALLRDSDGQWRSDGQWDKSDRALLGAMLTWSSVNFQTGRTSRNGAACAWMAKGWQISEGAVKQALAAAHRRGYVSSTRRTGGYGHAALRQVVLDPATEPGLAVGERARKAPAAVSPVQDPTRDVPARGVSVTSSWGERDQLSGERDQLWGERDQFSDERDHVISTDWSAPVVFSTAGEINTDADSTPGSAPHVPGRCNDEGAEIPVNGYERAPDPVSTSRSAEGSSNGGSDSETCAGSQIVAGDAGAVVWTAEEEPVVTDLAGAGIDVRPTDENREALAAVRAVGLDAAETVHQMLAMLAAESSLHPLLADGGVCHLLHDIAAVDWVVGVHRASGLPRASTALDRWFERLAS